MSKEILNINLSPSNIVKNFQLFYVHNIVELQSLDLISIDEAFILDLSLEIESYLSVALPSYDYNAEYMKSIYIDIKLLLQKFILAFVTSEDALKKLIRAVKSTIKFNVLISLVLIQVIPKPIASEDKIKIDFDQEHIFNISPSLYYELIDYIGMSIQKMTTYRNSYYIFELSSYYLQAIDRDATEYYEELFKSMTFDRMSIESILFPFVVNKSIKKGYVSNLTRWIQDKFTSVTVDIIGAKNEIALLNKDLANYVWTN